MSPLHIVKVISILEKNNQIHYNVYCTHLININTTNTSNIFSPFSFIIKLVVNYCF